MANLLSRYLRSMLANASQALSTGRNNVSSDVEFNSEKISGVTILLK